MEPPSIARRFEVRRIIRFTVGCDPWRSTYFSEAIDDHEDIHFFLRLFSVLHADVSSLIRNRFALRELSSMRCSNFLTLPLHVATWLVIADVSFGLAPIYDRHKNPIDPQRLPTPSLDGRF